MIHAAQGQRVAVTGPPDADDVRRLALVHGARFLPSTAGEPSSDGWASRAAGQGVAALADLGYDRVAVLRVLTTAAKDLSWLHDHQGITIVADQTGGGTSAISLPAACGFTFAFGPGSLHRHADGARSLGFEPHMVIDTAALSRSEEPSEVVDVVSVERWRGAGEGATQDEPARYPLGWQPSGTALHGHRQRGPT